MNDDKTQIDEQKIQEIINGNDDTEKHIPKHSDESPHDYCHRVRLDERQRIKDELKLE